MTLVALKLAALLLKLVGVVFLFSAALGIVRFRDAYQRMHAATKAGTVGSGFVILGVLLDAPAPGSLPIGLLTVVFLLVTIPVAGHLLGRAAYISGSRFDGPPGPDPLVDELPRAYAPLEARLVTPASRTDP